MSEGEKSKSEWKAIRFLSFVYPGTYSIIDNGYTHIATRGKCTQQEEPTSKQVRGKLINAFGNP